METALPDVFSIGSTALTITHDVSDIVERQSMFYESSSYYLIGSVTAGDTIS